MKDLIERLEKATGPDRLLEYDIYSRLGVPVTASGPPYYTASIDDALSLVNGRLWRVANTVDGRGIVDIGHNEALWKIEGATPAIALCIAALKARAAQRDMEAGR